jgi:hypothetical protein
MTPEPNAHTLSLFHRLRRGASSSSHSYTADHVTGDLTDVHQAAKIMSQQAQQTRQSNTGQKRKGNDQQGGATKRTRNLKMQKKNNSTKTKQENADDGDQKPDRLKPNGRGPCVSCCLGHNWCDCFRNPDSPRHSPDALKHCKMNNPHLKSTPAAREECIKKYGKIGVLAGEGEPPILPSYKGSPAFFCNMIRIGPNGARDIILHAMLENVNNVKLFVDTGLQVSLI